MDIHFTNFEKLIKAIKELRGSKVYIYKSKKIIKKTENFKFQKSEEEKEFETKGLDIDISSELFSTNNGELLTVLKDGSIRKPIIHIVDISSWSEKWGVSRFHIYECEKIIEMKSERKKNRYKASSRKDGKFYLIKNKRKWIETLEICKFCLDKYNEEFKNNETKATFPLKKWLENPFSDSELSKIKVELDICTVPNICTDAWPKISKHMKNQAGYICQSCEEDFSNPKYRKFLHTHHKDSNKRNNTGGNLEVLCIECHSNQHNHQHIKQTSDYKEYLNILENTCRKCNRDFSSPVCGEFLQMHPKELDIKDGIKKKRKICIECYSSENNSIKQSSAYKEWLNSECKKQINKQ